MPQTLYGNQVGSETLRAGKAVTMTIVAGSGATVERIRNGSAVAADAISATTVFGPFTEDMVLRVSVNSGATLTIGDEADQIVQRPTDAKATAIDSLVSGAWNTAKRGFSRKGFPLLANVTAASGHTLTWQSGTVGGIEYIERDGMRGIRLTTAAGLYVELNVPNFSRQIAKGQVAALYHVPDSPGNAVLTSVSLYVGDTGYTNAFNEVVTHSGSNVHANAHTGWFTIAPDPLSSPADTVRTEWQINANTPAWGSTTFTRAKMRITPQPGQVAVVEVFGIWCDGVQTVPKVCFVADDGYDSIYNLALPVFDTYDQRLSMAIIADSVGLGGYMTQTQLSDAVRRGHECVVHGPNGAAALNLSEYTSTAEIAADIAEGQNYLRGAGLVGNIFGAVSGDLLYMYPQGVYQHARDDHRIRTALEQCGIVGARIATVTQSSLAMQHAGLLPLHIPIIGHTWVDAPSEAANIARIIAKIQEAAVQGRSVVVMLHKITSGAAAQALEMAVADLTSICAAVSELERAGSAQCVSFGQLVHEMQSNLTPD